MTLRPTRPTLFPYTTLFRSRAPRAPPSRSRGPTLRRTPRPGWPYGRRHRRDRKSTRLNSSHTVISYAVFCLKKKNLTRNRHVTQEGRGEGRARLRVTHDDDH